MRVIMGPILPSCTSPPQCGVSSKVRVWLLAVMDSILKSMGQPALVRRAGGWEKPLLGTVPRQLSSGESVLLFLVSFCRQGAQKTKEIPNCLVGRSVALACTLKDNSEFALILGITQNFK